MQQDEPLIGSNSTMLEKDYDSELVNEQVVADIGLKLHTEIQTSTDQVDATKRVFENGDTSVLHVPLGDADTLVGCS
jgi:hypothetical protein